MKTIVIRRRTVGALGVACAAVLLGTATAHADPDPDVPAADPKSQCESPEVGGVFTAGLNNGVPHSVCQYIVKGYAYYDSYDDGAYVGTTVYRDGAQVPTERPEVQAPFELPATFSLLPF